MSKNIAILGYGIVGRGAFELIKNVKDKYNFNVKYVFDLESKRPLLGDLLCTDYNVIVNDPSIDVVIECMGGDEFPYKIITESLKHGKSIISSNKETISKHFDEYLKLAKDNNCQFLFEPAVGGGIPLIKPLVNITKFDKVICYKGILNGTCNYILTKVFEQNMTFSEALKEAQELGFAERDPSNDLNGNDLKRKGIILSSFLFNKKIKYDDIQAFGIQNINDEIVDKIKSMNKLLKFIVKGGDWDQLIILPVIVSKENVLATIKEEFNGVVVECAKNDRLTFIGKGAGSEPTASAIMQDLLTLEEGRFYIDREEATDMEVKFLEKGSFLTSRNGHIEIKEINTLAELREYDFVAKIQKN